MLKSVLCGAVMASATVYLDEQFSSLDKWVKSTAKGDDIGAIALDAGRWHDKADNKGLKLTQDAKFYQYTRPLDKEFSNKDKTLVLQYSVKHEQNIDCGGAYLKLLPKGYDPKTFDGESKYNIMFGPDICGATKRTHVIFNYKDDNHLVEKEVPCESDDTSHMYTLTVKPDNTFTVKIDGEEKRAGSLEEDFGMLPPKMIPDPSKPKPADWVDEAMMDDPEDVKPEGWDDIPEQIADPDAEKPDDWDEELDGEWTAPLIANPEYKGEWKPKRIDNPAYKGPYVQPQIANPEFKAVPNLYAYDSFAGVGLEVWQVKSGTIFNDLLVTDDAAVADARLDAFKAAREKEVEMRKKIKDEEAAAAEKARSEAEAAEEEEEADVEDDAKEEL